MVSCHANQENSSLHCSFMDVHLMVCVQTRRWLGVLSPVEILRYAANIKLDPYGITFGYTWICALKHAYHIPSWYLRLRKKTMKYMHWLWIRRFICFMDICCCLVAQHWGLWIDGLCPCYLGKYSSYLWRKSTKGTYMDMALFSCACWSTSTFTGCIQFHLGYIYTCALFP